MLRLTGTHAGKKRHRLGGGRIPWLATALLALTGSALADVVDVHEKALTDLLGAAPLALGTEVKVTDMSAGNLVVTVRSRAYTDNDGNYVYLYQIHNTGATGNSPAEMFTIWPFEGADGNTDLGFLSGSIPVGFDANTPAQNPWDKVSVKVLTTGPLISFYYTELFGGYSIDVGEHSRAMYVLSVLSPSEVTGNVIDGSVGTGPVVGPVPEPQVLV
ncbi:MAG TPA: hypothetical protein VMZ50_06260, partial [Phycisphaerae bacterium]|nr:hypothetical protein [Phycisphaerae bacterium]